MSARRFKYDYVIMVRLLKLVGYGCHDSAAVLRPAIRQPDFGRSNELGFGRIHEFISLGGWIIAQFRYDPVIRHCEHEPQPKILRKGQTTAKDHFAIRIGLRS